MHFHPAFSRTLQHCLDMFAMQQRSVLIPDFVMLFQAIEDRVGELEALQKVLREGIGRYRYHVSLRF